MLKLAIWDMDGTIIDSRKTIGDCMDAAFVACGLEAPGYARTRTIVGLGLRECCAILAPDDASEAVISQLTEAYVQAFVARRTSDRPADPLYAGAMESLTRLANDNWLLAIATGKSRRGLQSVFERTPELAKLFDTIWCADDGPGKPHPFMCLEAMDALGADPHQSLIIGDAVHDISMGKAAGLKTLGVSWGFGETGELEAVGAHEVHHSFETLNLSLENFRPTTPAV